MDISTMTFEEFLFHGRYHIIGAALFLVFFFVFIQEAVREVRAVHGRRSERLGESAHGSLVHDDLLGPTMADGGQPVDRKET